MKWVVIHNAAFPCLVRSTISGDKCLWWFSLHGKHTKTELVKLCKSENNINFVQISFQIITKYFKMLDIADIKPTMRLLQMSCYGREITWHWLLCRQCICYTIPHASLHVIRVLLFDTSCIFPCNVEHLSWFTILFLPRPIYPLYNFIKR